jgi:hypothetical protein
VVDQISHQGRVDLFELAERLAALVNDPFVAGLPAFQFGDLSLPLLAGDLGGFLGQLKLLLLVLEDLPLDVEGLRLQGHHCVEQREDVAIRAARRWDRRLSGGGNFHPVRP